MGVNAVDFRGHQDAVAGQVVDGLLRGRCEEGERARPWSYGLWRVEARDQLAAPEPARPPAGRAGAAGGLTVQAVVGTEKRIV
ncbi:hypothetical protein PL81_05845 [Streptomyces sp. RSD-27]|nr:hypothetical protein PL81_05845 [Streptomyces sp. RSD-27]